MTFLKKLTSLMVTLALLFSMAAPYVPVSVAAAETDPAPAATAKMTFRIVNAKVTDGNGVQILTGEYTAEPDTVLMLRAECADGFSNLAVAIDDAPQTVGEDGTFAVTAKDGITVTVTAEDIVPPVIASAIRQETGWVKEATYRITAADNVAVTGCKLTDSEGAETPLTADEDGTYLASVTENGTYTVTVSDAAGLTATTAITEATIDTTAPEILLVERQTTGITARADYVLQAEDTGSGIAEVSVTCNGVATVVTANTEGNYLFTVTSASFSIKITDAAGNETVQDITDGEVDATAPVITYSRTTNDWTNTEVIYKISVTDALSSVSAVTYAVGEGEAQTLALDADGKANITVTENCDIKITAEDSLGNSGSITVQEEKIDKVAPVMSVMQREHTGWAKAVTYTFTASDAASGIKEVTVKIGDAEAETITENNGIYQITVAENAQILVTVTDNAGNEAVASAAEEKTDNEGPSFTEIERKAEGWKTETEYSFSVEDTQSGVASVSVQYEDEEPITLTAENNIYTFAAEKNGTYIVTATDTAGNSEIETVTEDHIDTTAPEITDLERETDAWSVKAIYSFRVSDTQSGVGTVTVTIGEEEPLALIADNGQYQFEIEANTAFTINAADMLGNAISETGSESKIDVEAPTKPMLESSANGAWVNTDVTLTAVSTDSQSGIAAYWYTTEAIAFDRTNWKQMETTEEKGSLTLSAEQDATYYIVAEDGAGRISEIAEITVSIDKTAPADIAVAYIETLDAGFCRIVNGTYIYNDQVGFAATAQDPASNVVKYEYRLESSNGSTEWTAVVADASGIAPMISGLEDGVYAVYVRVTDKAGNTSEEATVMADGQPIQFILENTPANDEERAAAPAVAMNTPGGSYSGSWTNEDVTITVSGSWAVSGIEYYEVSVNYDEEHLEDVEWTTLRPDGGSCQLIVDQDTNAVYTFRAITYAGNISQMCSYCVRVQKTAPEAATISSEEATGTNGWYTRLPGYSISLPAQNPYFAPVHYEITYSHDGAAQAPIVYDGTNAPDISEDGVWVVTVTAHDAAGNTRTIANSTAHFSVDTKAPDGLSVKLDGSEILLAGTAETSWDEVNIFKDITASDYTIFKNGNALLTASAAGGDSGLAALYYMVLPEHGDPTTGEWSLLGNGATLMPDQKCHVYFKAVDAAGNISYFTAQSFILDQKAPVGTTGDALTLIPQSTNRSAHGYYNGDVTIAVEVLDPMVGEVFSGLKRVSYAVYADGQLTQSGQIHPGSGETELVDGRIQSWTGSFTVSAAANNSNHIVVTVTATDLAGNTRVTTIEDGVIRIDTDAPVMASSYDNNSKAATHNDKAAFTGSRTLTVQVEERNFIAEESFVVVTNTDTGAVSQYNWKSDGSNHTATIAITEDGHYSVSAIITDLAGNTTSAMSFAAGTAGANTFILDNTNPVVQVYYDNDSASNGMYFNAARTATVVVTDRNFEPRNMHLTFVVETEGGAIRTVSHGAWISDGNTHTTYLDCTTDGVYTVSVAGSDALGNAATNISYAGTAPNQWVLDTKFAAPEISQVEASHAYSGTLTPKATVTDINLQSVNVQLLRTRRDEIGVDVTNEMLKGKFTWTDIAGGKEALLDVFPEAQEYDGVYTLTVTGQDKAGNTAESSVTFSVNRFGSVYVYDDVLVGMMNGYMQQVPGDLIVTEYNPSGIVPGTAKVYITLDGSPIADPIYTIDPVAAENMMPGRSGWFEHQYVIAAENFTEEGIYEVVISTQDYAGNIPENTADEMAIRFAVDNQAPDLISITGLEATIYKADSIVATISAQDNVALGSICVYVNNDVVAQWDNIGSYELQCEFTVPSGLEQHIRIVVTDMAGNTLDTDAENFAPGYVFNNTVTVSTNLLLRYYANKPLFYGSTATAGTAAIAGILILLKKKKK